MVGLSGPTSPRIVLLGFGLAGYSGEATVSISECFAFGFKIRHNCNDVERILPTPKTSHRRGTDRTVPTVILNGRFGKTTYVFQKLCQCIRWALVMAFQKYFVHLFAQPDCRFLFEIFKNKILTVKAGK